ncbi:MAG TPA: hypothetical protein VFW28_13520 [Micropepsaceae bacterium]|nr:hypothetical protein [Micropepsaceae bacterium]
MMWGEMMKNLGERARVNCLLACGAQKIMAGFEGLTQGLSNKYLAYEFTNFRVHLRIIASVDP